MRTTTRRRNRLRSTHYGTERWKPPLALAVLAVGVVLGVILGLSNRPGGQAESIQQHYMLLVSDLYAQGAPITSVHDRLVSVGYSNPSVAVLAVADQLAQSSDKVSQEEATQLHQFAQALVAGPASEATVVGGAEKGASPPAAKPSPPASTPVPVVAVPTQTPTTAPTIVPSPTVIDQPTVEPTVTPSPPQPTATTAPPPPTATPVNPTATAAPRKAGTVQTSGNSSAILRKIPWTKSPAVATIPDGAQIDVYGIAHGEELQHGEDRWYHVVYKGHAGYLYYPLVHLGG